MSPMKAQVINQPVIAVTSFPSTGFNITSSKPSTAQQRRQKFQAVSTLPLNAKIRVDDSDVGDIVMLLTL